ncbi:MAG: lipase family protein [Desulfosarcinaceae bacterium]|nr:lipase family protein [Desulfosarcinaceae bacterium]
MSNGTPHVQCALILSTASRPAPFAVLVFRGTMGSLEAWLPNFYSLPSPWSHDPAEGQIHRGFQRCFEEIWPELAPVLATVRRPIFYTGHSLGGALATLTAARRAPTAVYTFGAPRMGDQAFVTYLKDRAIYRVFTANDIVTSMPPTMGEVSFLPVGKPFELPHHTPAGPRPSLPQQLHKRPLRESPPAFLGDHAPLKYSRQLARFISAGRAV